MSYFRMPLFYLDGAVHQHPDDLCDAAADRGDDHCSRSTAISASTSSPTSLAAT